MTSHDVVDQVLMHLARVLSESLRTTDLCARWGGEEFMAVEQVTAIFCVAKAASNELAAGVIKRSIRPREKAATG